MGEKLRPTLRQILAQLLHNLFWLGLRWILQIFPKEHQVTLPAILNMPRFHETVVLPRVGHVFYQHVAVHTARDKILPPATSASAYPIACLASTSRSSHAPHFS